MKRQTRPFTVVRKGGPREKSELKAIMLRKIAFGEGPNRADVQAGILLKRAAHQRAIFRTGWPSRSTNIWREVDGVTDGSPARTSVGGLGTCSDAVEISVRGVGPLNTAAATMIQQTPVANTRAANQFGDIYTPKSPPRQ
jgi:hypothetical protein